MLLGSDAAKELNENGQPPGWVGCRCGKFVHTLAAHTGRRAWDGRLANFFFTAASSKGGERKRWSFAVRGVGFSPIAGMVPVVGVQWSNASRDVRPVQQWSTSTKFKGPTASLSYHLSYPCELPQPAVLVGTSSPCQSLDRSQWPLWIGGRGRGGGLSLDTGRKQVPLPAYWTTCITVPSSSQ